LIAALLACVVPTSGSPGLGPAHATQALLTYVAANRGICLVRADGTHPVRLTPRWKGLGEPAWSPRGRYVAFKRFAGDGAVHNSRIAVADARGHVHWTFGAWDKNGSPLWSPDGRHIAYRGTALDGRGGFDVARPDGSDDHRLVECDGYCSALPSWSADGQRLAFEDRPDPSSPLGIVSTLADGSDRRLLVADAQEPAYSPRGSKLAYVHVDLEPSGAVTTLFVADADGRNRRALTPPSTGGVGWPTWSPDGTFLAFVERLPSGDEGEVVVVRADGSGEPVVIASHVPLNTYFRTPAEAWSPGGKLIAFVRGRSLVVASAEGGSERVVVSRVGNVGYTSDGVSLGAWRPAVALPAARRPACP
jgi:Tol biopolymer transport system component